MSNQQPSIIGKWNWGAFALSWIWGIFNGAYLSLLCLIPGLNVIWIFVCALKGNEWAWNSGKYTSVEEFEEAQRKWSKAGIIVLIISVVLGIISGIAYGALIAALMGSMAY